MTIEGNRAFSDKAIVERLALRPPKGWPIAKWTRFDPLALRLDQRRVRSYYRERGYFSARIEDAEIERVAGELVDLRYHVDEGSPTRIASVGVLGLPSDPRLAEPDLRKATRLAIGEVFVHPRYLRAKDTLTARLLAKGYAHARVDGEVRVNRDSREADVDFHLRPGPLVHFGKVRVAGLKRLPDSSVLARVTWEEGELFDPKQLDHTQARLYQLGYFSGVRIGYPTQGAVVDPTIQVTEALRHELRLGAGVAIDRRRVDVHGRAGYVVRSWLRPLLTLRLDTRPGYVVIPERDVDQGFTGEASVTVEKEDFLTPLLRAQSVAAYEISVLEAYETRGPRGRLALERPFLNEHLRLGVGWQVRYLTIDTDSAEIGELIDAPDPYRLGFYEQTLTADWRDDILAAKRGIYGSLSLEEGTAAAGSAFSYLKATPELRLYVPVGERLVLAWRGRGGLLDAIGDDVAPLTQRYYGGGASGHRGFAYRRLSPQGRTTDGRLIPLGGDALVETSAEARLEVVRLAERWLSVVAFLDGGDVTSTWGAVHFDDLHWAAGGGLRYDTIVGPIRLDVGVRLNRLGAAGPDGLRNPDPGDQLAFHFSLGEAF